MLEDWLSLKRHTGVLDMTRGREYWSPRELTRLDEEGWLRHNWEAEWKHAEETPARKSVIKALLSTGGPVLELAAGPGGGNLAPMLRGSDNIRLIVNDLESRLLYRWRAFLKEQGMLHRVAFLACDAAALPLADASVAAVSSRGGISNAMGTHRDILAECARVLKPGGVVGTYELSLSERTLHNLPTALRETREYNAFLYRDWSALLLGTGLKLESVAVGETFTMDRTSALGADAAEYNFVLEAEMVAVVMVKSMH